MNRSEDAPAPLISDFLLKTHKLKLSNYALTTNEMPSQPYAHQNIGKKAVIKFPRLPLKWCGFSCTYLPLRQLFRAVLSFFFGKEKREGRTDGDQQLTYSLVDAHPVGFLMVYIANKVRAERYFCLLGNYIRKDVSVVSCGFSRQESPATATGCSQNVYNRYLVFPNGSAALS